jgi:phosphopantothenoylcysteine decarboxylase/phosphopantothenate--cysteine ligase
VAPATAAFLGRYAAGIADDLLLNTLLASKAPVVVVPAMHTEMWQNPATQANVALLRSRGVVVMDPDSGRLTGSDTGPGRLPEPEAIVSFALAALGHRTAQTSSLYGKHFVISAGGTREAIDPVRFIGNHSSGKQGVAIALAAKAAGASVTLVGANLAVLPSGIDKVIEVVTAKELAAAIDDLLPTADVLVMTAAVADFRVENPQTQKIKRSEIGNELELRLVANPDILAEAVEFIEAQGLNCLTVGFAAETAGSMERLASLATMKLAGKGCDIIVANDVTDGAVFGQDHTSVYLLDQQGESSHKTGSKIDVAAEIVSFIAARVI